MDLSDPDANMDPRMLWLLIMCQEICITSIVKSLCTDADSEQRSLLGCQWMMVLEMNIVSSFASRAELITSELHLLTSSLATSSMQSEYPWRSYTLAKRVVTRMRLECFKLELLPFA